MSPAETPTTDASQPERPLDLEKRYVWCVSILFALAMSLPHLWAWITPPYGSAWGGLIWKTFDPNVHLAWARQAQDGHFFFRDLFTTEGLVSGERPLFFNLLPMLWGWLGHTGLPIIFWFHLTRVAAGVWTLWEFHHLARLTLPRFSERATALWLVAFTTGSSFIAVFIPNLAQNFIFIDHPNPPGFPTMPEAFVFTSAFAYPLNIVAYGLMAFLARSILTKQPSTARAAFIAFLAAVLLSNIHTYDAIPLGLTLVVWIIWTLAKERQGLIISGAILAGLALPVLYQFLVFRGSEEFRLKALTPTPAPPFHFIAISMVFLMLPALLGAIQLQWGMSALNRPGIKLIITWAAVTLICIYLPVSFARKMLEGAQLPLAILAAAGYAWVAQAISNRTARYAVMAITALLLSLSPAYFTVYCLEKASTNNREFYGAMMPPHYLAQSEWDTLKYLDQNGDRQFAVMSLPFVGVYGPRETDMTFYLSHWAETLNFADKVRLGLRFYSDRLSPPEARNLLLSNKIRYVLESQYERALGHDSNYAMSYGLIPIKTFGVGDTRTVLYQVPDS